MRRRSEEPKGTVQPNAAARRKGRKVSPRAGQSLYQHLLAYALAFPEAREEHPWGETAIKVRGKIFLFMGGADGELRLTIKLPNSREFALEYPFAAPARHGLGNSGWVTASFGAKTPAPVDVLEAWICESYRAVAPKVLAGKLPVLSSALPARGR